MKIYLCSHCGETVPLSSLAEHRQTCGPDAELSVKADWRMKSRKVFGIIFAIVGLAALTVGSLLMGKASFNSIAKMRALERVPATEVHAVLPGEINLTGSVAKLRSLLKAPKTGTQCVYYRYVVEKKTRDSDGDTKWETITDESRYADFMLKDGSGEIPVRPGSNVDFNADKSFKTESGNMRYTEYRIDPGDTVFLFGYIVAKNGKSEVRFDKPGHYSPIISERGEARERVGMASLSVGLCWGGLVCLAFATGLTAWLLRLHRLLVYFVILSVILAIYLCILGLQMMKLDLQSGSDRLKRHESAAIEVIRETRGTSIRWNGDWSKLGSFDAVTGLNKAQKKRLNRIRLDLAVAVKRFQRQRAAFPERLLAPGWGIEMPADLPIPDSQKAELEALSAQFKEAAVPPVFGWIVVGAAFLIGGATVTGGIRRVRFKRCIENLPTSRTAAAAYGLCELKGIIELDSDEEPLKGPLTSMPCVQYHYVVKERRRSGKKTTWVTIVDERQSRPFLCVDSEGRMKIEPAGAKVYTEHVSRKHMGKWRYEETRLELNDPLYAIGECVIDPEKGDELQLQKPDGDYPFIISNMTENRVMRKVAAIGVVFLNFAFSAFLLTALVLFGLSGSFAATDYLASALVTPVFMTFVMLVLHYNDLVFLRERADRNWSNIDVSLKKRHDLIPNLEQVVKSYMSHENELQKAITEMRSTYAQSGSRDPKSIGQFMEAEHAAASQMLAVFESYPDLKANQTISLLMAKMIGMENEIAFMRSGYNQAVETYNTRTATVPDVIFAKMFGFKEKQFISAETEVIRMPVSVSDMSRQAAAEQPHAPVSQDEPEAGTQGAAPTALPENTAPTDQEIQEAADGRAVIYALLLNPEEDVQKAQLDAIAEDESPEMRGKTAGLIEAVAKEITDPVERLKTAEQWLPKLTALRPSEHDIFVRIVRRLMEQDRNISLFEYALSKSMDRRLEPHFTSHEPPPVRHRDLSLITAQVSLVLSRLSQAEEAPSDTAQAAFNEGVAVLTHEPKSDFVLQAPGTCTLAAFDEAVDEIALASEEVRRNVLEACTKLVVMNDDYTWDQAMLASAVADVFGLDRPNWM